MIRGKEFHPIIERIFHDVKGYLETEQIQVNCPRCQEREGLTHPDDKFNLEINTAKKVFRCWKCDAPKFSGSLKRLIKIYGTSIDLKMYEEYGGDDYFSYETNETEEISFVELPEEFISFKDMSDYNILHTEAYKYLLLERKIPKETIYKYNLGFAIEGKYEGRIIIPSYDGFGNLNYFVSRAFRHGMKPPYLNPKVDKDRIIFNEGLINWDSTVYLVEGIFEVLSFPVNTVPMLGKTISKSMFMALSEKKPTLVIIFDPDAITNAIEVFQKLQAIYVGQEDKIRLVELTGKYDLDEIRRYQGITEMNKLIRTARPLKEEDFFKFKKYEEDKRYYSNSGYKRW
jgi:hypothetical protein